MGKVTSSSTMTAGSRLMAEDLNRMSYNLKMEQMKRALKNIKEGRSGDDNGSSNEADGGGALAEALNKLGTKLSVSAAGGAGANGADGLDASALADQQFNQQRTILGDRASQEMEMEKLKAGLEAKRRKQSLSDAMSSLSRFR